MKTMRSFFTALAALAALASALHGADFTNAFVTTIPASGNATPYPSTVTVPEGAVTGPVLSVQVRITGFTHTHPQDVDVFLVAPSGAVAAVFSDAGDSTGTNASNLILLFDDAAATEIPGNAFFLSGTYRPANHAPGEAPPPLTTGTIGTNLTALAAGGVEGQWKLYVSDDAAGDSGSITSWTLTIVTPFEVTNTNDSGTGSLRWALANAAAIPGADTITFASNLPSGTINLTTFTNPGSGNTALVIADAGGVTIDASGFSGGITLNGAGAAGTYRLIQVNSGSLTLRGLTLANGGGSGFTAYGGAIANNGGHLTLERCTLRDNRVGGGPFGGGAILNNGGALSLTCTQCTFSGNSFNGNPDPGSSGGGAINNRASTAATLTHCTFSSNSTNQSGGAILTTTGGTSVTLINTIVAGNTATVSGPDVGSWGTITASGKNLLSATIAGPGSVTNSGNLIVNPTTLLAPLGANGGPTQTMPPLANSPAIDAVSAVGGLSTDQRGLPYASGPAADIGAVELQEIRVNTLADENNGIGVNQVSLREALTSTAPGVAEVVRFAPAVFIATLPATNTISLGSEIAVSKSVLVDASDIAAGVTLDDGGAQNFRLINMQGGNLALRGLTLANGGGSTFGGGGGAIYNSSGTLTLTGCTLTGNTANSGGAILNAATATLTHCTLAGNTAGGGGAIKNFGPLTVTHCTLSGNTASGGGGIDNNGPLTLTNTLIAGNTATIGATHGPDIYNLGTITRVGVNLVQDLDHVSTGTETGPGSILAGPAPLASLGNYGGPTQTRPPLANSPAIDAASAVGGLSTDQRGLPYASGPAADIGAVELQEIRVNTLADQNDGIGVNQVSLREALTTSTPGVAEVVRFAPAVFNGTPVGKNTIRLLGSEIVVAKSVLVDAGDIPAGVTLDGGAQNFRLILMQGGSNLALRGLTLANGRAPVSGGAIYSELSTLTLTRCTLSGNFALNGGAIYSHTAADFITSSTTLTHCTLAGNSATNIGGAIYNFNGRTTLLHCTVSGNTAPAGGGSGVFSFGNAFTETVVQNSIIAGNVNSDVNFGFGVTNSFNSQGYNRIGTGNATAPTNRFNATGDLINVAPLLAPLGDYGGPTRTMLPLALPLPGSPAIDAALTSTATTDQRGIARPQGTARDIGAVETFTLTGFQDGDNDGMDDRLEPLYGFIVGVADGALDADGDGSSNAAELGNKTSPRDSTSLLRILAFTPAPPNTNGNPRFHVTWTSFPGLRYTIEEKADLNFAVNPGESDTVTATAFTHTLRIELDKTNPKDFIRVRRD